MTISTWRIVKAKHAATAFSGQGAKDAGGRWNSPGVAVIYTSASESLAMLETLVHVQSQDLLKRYVLFEVSFDDSLVKIIEASDLPKMWRKSPPPVSIQRIGDKWVAGLESAVLKVPSVVVPNEWNYVLNPAHRDFAKIIVGPKRLAQFDQRLVKKTTK